MEAVYSFGYILLLGGGGIISLYLYKSNIKAGGQLLGISSLALGSTGLISSFLAVDGTAYRLIWITFGLSLVGVFYVEFRRPLAVIFLALPFYVLVLMFIISLPFLLLFATLALEVGILDAYKISRLDNTSLSKIRAEERGLRALLAPFSGLSVLTESVFRGRSTRDLMFLSYSLLPVALALLALMIWLVAKAPEVAYVLIIVTGAYFAVTSNKLTNRG